jgi:hypothetical protein
MKIFIKKNCLFLKYCSRIIFLAVLLVNNSCATANHQINNPSQNSRILAAARISASQSQFTRSLDNNFFCFNTNVLLFDSWHNSQFHHAVNQLSPKMLRIPGGIIGDYWDWRRGGVVQDLSELPPMLKQNRIREYTGSKLENIKVGLEATNTIPLFTLNMLTSDLNSQIAMLRQARKIGIPVKYIELGNEYYEDREKYRAIFPTPEDYDSTVNQWLSVLKQEFPEAKISLIGVIPKLRPRNSNRENDWNNALLNSSLKKADAIALHFYGPSGLSRGPNTINDYPFFDSENVPRILAAPFFFWRKIQNSEQFKTIPSYKQIWITEYSLFEPVERQQSPKVVGSWTHGMYTLAMSLLFLEDKRVNSICNHVLIGNSQFGAIFADEKAIGMNVFINPSQRVSTYPFSLSATGSALRFLGNATKDMTKATKINFSHNPFLMVGNGFQYSALYGWKFSNGRDSRAVIMNLSNQNLKIDLSSLFTQTVNYEQISGNPRDLVTGNGILNETQGSISGQINLPAYSVTQLSTSMYSNSKQVVEKSFLKRQ